MHKSIFQMFYKFSLINFITYFYYLVTESSHLLPKETGPDEQGKQNNEYFMLNLTRTSINQIMPV